MRIIACFLLFASLSFSIGFFERKEDPARLEVKIIERILTDLIRKERVNVVLLGEGKEEAEEKIRRFSDKLRLVRECGEADVLLLTGRVRLEGECRIKPAFSLDRRLLMRWENCIGAFYWKKGRPNIIFLRERLKKLRIDLPSEYDRFIESLRGYLLRRAGS